MPSFKKRALSLYLRNQCERQFVLYLYNDEEREQYEMPSRDQNRAVLGLVGQAGYEWQNKKVRELQDLFGQERVHESIGGIATRPASIPLADVLPHVKAYHFIVEATFSAATSIFKRALGFDKLTDYYGNTIDLGDARPDVIQVLPAASEGINPTTDLVPDPYQLAVEPNGTLKELDNTDTRLRLRVIDIKLTSEPGANYFAEVVYYSTSLAAWLVEYGYSEQFVVVAAPAVWPGSHATSHLRKKLEEWKAHAYQATGQDLMDALEKDVELAVFDVFAPRIEQLLTDELPALLQQPWQEAAWHVDHRCKGCEFLGYPWNPEQPPKDPRRCWPTAERHHELHRVYGLSRGAASQLRQYNVVDIPTLAATTPSSNIFDDHQGLRTKRSAFPHRARALQTGETSIIPHSGGDAQMPRWPNLHIYLFLDYDLSSAITSTMGVRAFWREPLPYGSTHQSQTQRWPQSSDEGEVFLVDRRDINEERQEFLKFLQHLTNIVNTVRNQDATDRQNNRRDQKTEHSTYQIYLWDEAQRQHLIRLVGRHLPYILAKRSLQELVWLFPPPELLPPAEEASQQSTVTLVKPIVENTVALNHPHYYRLVDLAGAVTPPNLSAPFVPDLYTEPFSDLIPMERLHEYWNHVGKWVRSQQNIIQTTRAKTIGLEFIVRWLERKLSAYLSRSAAPPIVRHQQTIPRLALVSRLWLGYLKLDAAVTELEIRAIRAMPPHEREARLKAARLQTRLEGDTRQRALQQLRDVAGLPLRNTSDLLVYRMRSGSYDVNMKPGDFLLAISPETIHGFLDHHPITYIKDLDIKGVYGNSIDQAGCTAVSIEAIDRRAGLIALRPGQRNIVGALEQHLALNFSQNVILDLTHKDFLTSKVELTLRGVKNPPSSSIDPAVLQALGMATATPGTHAETPASEVLWQAGDLALQKYVESVDSVQLLLKKYLQLSGATLNDSQWTAWQAALTRRFALLWGPPGTGKSRTLRAIILGAALQAQQQQTPLRLLVSATTYTAIDNVLLDIEQELRAIVGVDHYQIFRIQSGLSEARPVTWQTEYPSLQTLALNRRDPSPDIENLRKLLDKPCGIVVVGCPPQQLHNLAIARKSNNDPRIQDTMRSWFDMIIVDEASQMDVATSTLIFTKRAPQGACVLAGDNLQLPPIHKAHPPEGLNDVVGSVYNYFRRYHDIAPYSLDINYRSNATIIEFVRQAGYSDALSSYSPRLRLDMGNPPLTQPVAWPESLPWDPLWLEMLDPTTPTLSFLYHDMLSSQVNPFEADVVAALVWLLKHNLRSQLLEERMPNGNTLAPVTALYSDEQFWTRAVGVVTPHRAQMAKVVSRLTSLFPTDSPNDIYNAVDTVERYQGQQRDVIIASFGVGDPDIVQSEDEFLYNLNRFNVLVSRARAKVIVLLTETVLHHLSNDVDILRESRLLKKYVMSHCQESRQVTLDYLQGARVQQKFGTLRWRNSE